LVAAFSWALAGMKPTTRSAEPAIAAVADHLAIVVTSLVLLTEDRRSAVRAHASANPARASKSATSDAFLASLGGPGRLLARQRLFAGERSRPRSAPGTSRAPTRPSCCRAKTAVQASSTTQLTEVEAVTRIGDPGQPTQGPIQVFVRGDALLFRGPSPRSPR
jgi:hypothetical protein